MILSRTPYRISFFGGGTDFPAWYSQWGGCVLGATIDKFCYITVRHLPPFFDYKHRVVYSQLEHVREIADIKHPAVRAVLETFRVSEGLEIHYDGDLPARSGLGSTSAFIVGLIHALKALNGEMIAKQELADLTIRIEEEVLKENVGSQNSILTAFGGLNKIQFNRDRTYVVSPVIMARERIVEFQNHLVLFLRVFPNMEVKPQKPTWPISCEINKPLKI